VNIRKETSQKHDVDEWCKAREVKICCHVDHTATYMQQFNTLYLQHYLNRNWGWKSTRGDNRSWVLQRRWTEISNYTDMYDECKNL